MIANINWGADRKTLEILYKLLIQVKIDYGSIVQSNAKPQILKKLDVVQNTPLD